MRQYDPRRINYYRKVDDMKHTGQILPFEDEFRTGRDFISGQKIVKIPEGTYDFAFVCYETKRLHVNAFKLVIWFRLVSPGEHHGVVLGRYYNIKRIIGKPGLNGGFKVGPKSDFIREYAALFGCIPKRLDRIPMSPFSPVVLEGVTHTVSISARRRPIPEPARYSVINQLTKRITGR